MKENKTKKNKINSWQVSCLTDFNGWYGKHCIESKVLTAFSVRHCQCLLAAIFEIPTSGSRELTLTKSRSHVDMVINKKMKCLLSQKKWLSNWNVLAHKWIFLTQLNISIKGAGRLVAGLIDLKIPSLPVCSRWDLKFAAKKSMIREISLCQYLLRICNFRERRKKKHNFWLVEVLPTHSSEQAIVDIQITCLVL